MKICIISLFFLSGSFFLSAQDKSKTQNQLLNVYSENTVNTIMNSDSKLKYYDFLLHKSFQIVDYGQTEKLNGIPVLSHLSKKNGSGVTLVNAEDVVTEYNNGTFNILSYDLERSYNTAKYYRLGSSTYVITLYSLNTFKN